MAETSINRLFGNEIRPLPKHPIYPQGLRKPIDSPSGPVTKLTKLTVLYGENSPPAVRADHEYHYERI